MKIHCFLLCYNEIDIMPLVIKHYQKFCDKITIMDNHSTDGSPELARSLGCEVIPFGDKFFNDRINMEVKNSCWKGSDADWVICCDFDEILFSNASNPIASIESTLIMYRDRGTTIAKTIGWQIMSDDWPAHDLLEISNGYRFDNYSKNIIFNPNEITDINYGPGSHECKPEGNVVWSGEGLMVLHYKHIGGVQRTIDRYRECAKRMSKENRKMGWGVHNFTPPAKLRQQWKERMAKSKPLF